MNEGTTGTDIHYFSGNELLWDQHNTRPINGRSWLQPFFLIKRHKRTLSTLDFAFGFVLRTPTLRADSQFRILDFWVQFMISKLQFRFRDLFFDSHEFFSRFSMRNPPSSTLTSVATKLTYCRLNSNPKEMAIVNLCLFFTRERRTGSVLWFLNRTYKDRTV